MTRISSGDPKSPSNPIRTSPIVPIVVPVDTPSTGLEGTKGGGFLAINKENGELALLIPEEIDKPNIKYRISKLKKQLKLDNPPSMCYNPIPDGKSGNMKLPKQCIYCRHKFTCHKDSNNGKGLRVFKYAKNLEFFTTVVKQPRVQEITDEWQKG